MLTTDLFIVWTDAGRISKNQFTLQQLSGRSVNPDYADMAERFAIFYQHGRRGK